MLADVDRMHGSQVGAEDAFSLEQLSRCAALDCEALFDLRRLLREVDVQRHAPLARVRRDDAHRFRIDSAHAVDGGGQSRAVGVFHLVHAQRPAVRIAVGERKLLRLQRTAIETAPQVARVDQRDADPFFMRRVDQRLAKPVAMAV